MECLEDLFCLQAQRLLLTVCGTATATLLRPGHFAESILKLLPESWLDCWGPQVVEKQLCFVSLQALRGLNVAQFS